MRRNSFSRRVVLCFIRTLRDCWDTLLIEAGKEVEARKDDQQTPHRQKVAEIGAAWRDLPDEERARFAQRAAAAEVRLLPLSPLAHSAKNVILRKRVLKTKTT